MRMLPRKRMNDDPQNIVQFWKNKENKENKEIKNKIEQLGWSKKERRMLGLI